MRILGKNEQGLLLWAVKNLVWEINRRQKAGKMCLPGALQAANAVWTWKRGTDHLKGPTHLHALPVLSPLLLKAPGTLRVTDAFVPLKEVRK